MDSWNGDFSWARVTKATKGWPSGFVHFKDVQIANTAVPKITGTPKVGSTLTASAGSWSVTGSSYAYQWLADGAAISGATSSTLALTNAVKDKAITVRVVASQLGYPNTAAYSAATSAVQPGVIANTDPPTISGGPARRLDADRAAGIVVAGTGDAELPVAGRRPVRRRADRPHVGPRSRPDRQGHQGRGDRDEDRLHRRQGTLRSDRPGGARPDAFDVTTGRQR